MHNTPEGRYRGDNHFKALVDMMVAHISQCNYTPSEMREAAIFASIMHERTTVQRIIVPDIPRVVEECLEALHKWEEEWLTSHSNEQGKST